MYEVYFDSLFLINFVMNLYLYTLVNRTLKRTATRSRVIGFSMAGAAVYCIFIILPGLSAVIKRFAAPMLINLAVTAAIFKIDKAGELFRCTGYVYLYAFFFGGIMKFLFSSVSFMKNRQESIWTVLGAGIIGYEALSWLLQQIKRKKNENICRVKLLGYGNEVVLDALVDTGNSLVEPISRKPVSVMEETVFDTLEGVRIPEKMKIIPFHSVGKNNGIMEGYEIPEIIIEDNGESIRWQKVIVGISKNEISASGKYQMILHPDLAGTAVVNQKSRRKINDIKSGNAGKSSV